MVALVSELDELRVTGRKGYGARMLLGVCIVKGLFGYPTVRRTVRRIADHDALAEAIGGRPSEWACYRFSAKLRANYPILSNAVDRLVSALHELVPTLGRQVAIDGSDLPAYANGSMRRCRSDPVRTHYADPDATWGHRSATGNRTAGNFYGFKIHAAVDIATELPLAWTIRPANEHDYPQLEVLLDELALRGVHPSTVVLDKGYDYDVAYELCMDRGADPIIAMRMTRDVLENPTVVPECEHGMWIFSGAERARRRVKFRCPTGQCRPKSRWFRANRRRPIVPRKTKRWQTLYNSRGAIEREFARLKHERGLLPLRLRGLPRVALHADLCVFARLAEALTRARAGP